MTYKTTTINGWDGALDTLGTVAGEPTQGETIVIDSQSVPKAAPKPTTVVAHLAGGASTTSSSVSLFVPLTSSAYPYFLEIGPLAINNVARLTSAASAGLTWLYNVYGGGATRYVNALQITTVGTYRLRAVWCVGSLSVSGAYVDVQWQTSSGVKLGPITRLGRSDEKRNSCEGVVEITTSDVVGLYVHSLNGAKYNLDNFDNILISVEKIA